MIVVWEKSDWKITILGILGILYDSFDFSDFFSFFFRESLQFCLAS